jgi:hypothetical protein
MTKTPKPHSTRPDASATTATATLSGAKRMSSVEMVSTEFFSRQTDFHTSMQHLISLLGSANIKEQLSATDNRKLKHFLKPYMTLAKNPFPKLGSLTNKSTQTQPKKQLVPISLGEQLDTILKITNIESKENNPFYETLKAMRVASDQYREFIAFLRYVQNNITFDDDQSKMIHDYPIKPTQYAMRYGLLINALLNDPTGKKDPIVIEKKDELGKRQRAIEVELKKESDTLNNSKQEILTACEEILSHFKIQKILLTKFFHQRNSDANRKNQAGMLVKKLDTIIKIIESKQLLLLDEPNKTLSSNEPDKKNINFQLAKSLLQEVQEGIARADIEYDNICKEIYDKTLEARNKESKSIKSATKEKNTISIHDTLSKYEDTKIQRLKNLEDMEYNTYMIAPIYDLLLRCYDLLTRQIDLIKNAKEDSDATLLAEDLSKLRKELAPASYLRRSSHNKNNINVLEKAVAASLAQDLLEKGIRKITKISPELKKQCDMNAKQFETATKAVLKRVGEEKVFQKRDELSAAIKSTFPRL